MNRPRVSMFGPTRNCVRQIQAERIAYNGLTAAGRFATAALVKWYGVRRARLALEKIDRRAIRRGAA